MIAIPDLDKRRTALLGAADVLIVLRKYPEAAALLNAGAEGASESSSIRARASILARTRKFENLSLDPKAPATILWRLLESAFATQGTNKEFMELFSSGMRATMSSDADPGAFRRGVASSLAGRGTSGEVALDLCYALGQVSVEGDEAKGYRVRIQLPNNNNVQNMVWYVSREKGRNVISGTDFAESTLGTEALRRVDLGDLAGARGFLDWAREQIEPGGGDDPLSGHPFTRFWTRGQEADAETIRAAAASLQVSDKECTGAVPLLRSARAKAMDDSARLRFDAALMTAHAVRSEWVDLEAVTGRLFTAYPSSKKVMSMRCRALSALKRWEEILPILDKQLERTPRDPDLIESKLSALGYLGRDEEGERLSLSMVTSGQATPWTFNHLAWGQLVAGRVTEQTLEFARKSLMLRPDGYPAAQHTLAAVLAERGETAEALELFFKRIGNGMEEKLEGDDWYLLGRIAEQFGESGAALKCYARVSTPEPRENAAKSCFALATRRLAALGKPRVGPSPSFK
jgi:tetratricopeptide (TPR) repeat protein